MNGFNKLISVVLVLSFMMGLYTYGTSETYSFKAHLESIRDVTNDIPSVDVLTEIWTMPILNITDAGLQVPAGSIFHRFTLGADGTDEFYIFNWFDLLDWGVFEPINQFFSGVVEFVSRLGFTFIWGANYFVGVLKLVGAVTPVSGVVPRG